jgi:hypothetical protein
VKEARLKLYYNIYDILEKAIHSDKNQIRHLTGPWVRERDKYKRTLENLGTKLCGLISSLWWSLRDMCQKLQK